MKNKIVALLCLLAMIVGFAAAGLTTNAATDHYLVGYSIQDINPWKDPADHSKGILPVELTGNGDDSERVATGLMDDNDDGKIGEGDGLYTTATAVTDPHGKTVMYITIDALQGYEDITKDARTKIVAALGETVISADEIMVSGSHSHSAPSMSRTYTEGNYYNYIMQQIVNAATQAYADRAEAVMTKGAIDAKDSTAYLGYNKGAGYHMNSVRHYNVNSQHKTNGVIRAQHVSGSGFGSMGTTMAGYKATSATAVAESDNTMYVLLFEFLNDSNKEPVVFVNWRAHTTTNSGGNTKALVSSDYVNSVRANLKTEGYRAAFFQGASGNIITKDTQSADWTAECNMEANTNVYGRILSDVVVDCITRKMSEQLPAGRIQTLQKIYHGQRQEDSAGLLAAAKAFQANASAKVPYQYTYTDGNVYTINSEFHASSIIKRSTETYYSYTNLELNVILLGDAAAFVTAPGEMSDRYDINGSLKDEDNDWLELVQEATYGTPFVLGYTNDSKGYFPAMLDYTYNTREYYDITKKGADGYRFHGAGSYEANTSRLARGSGEEIIQTFKKMLTDVKHRYYECQACKEVVEWKPVTGVGSGAMSITSGHYYLDEDIPMSTSGGNRCSVASGKVLCLDLKGHTMESKGRSFHVNGTLNLFDSVGTARVTSYSSGSNVGGGVIGINGTLNIYGGTYQFIRREVSTATAFGAVLSVSGTANMYGGTLIGGELVKTTYYSPTHRANGYGGTVYVNGAFNVYGGRIIAGSAAPGAAGDCVYLTDSCDGITISGDAVIDEIYIEDDTESDGRLTVDGTFTGKAPVWYKHEIHTITEGVKIGNSKNATFTAENLYCTSHPEYAFTISGEELVAGSWGEDAVAVIATVNGNTAYTTLATAINDFREGYIVLLKDTEQAVTVNKDAYLDLNGHSITGKVTVAQGKTLYCMDSETDDYTVADGIYGKIADVTGNIAGFPLNTGVRKDSYLMLRENNAYSFHRVNLQMTDMVLRAEEAGVYYKSQFAGDEMVEKNVKQFGVAMSVKGMPTAENVNTDCVLSWFDGFKAGANGDNTSTLLKNVMRLGVTDQMNQERAQLAIYGRAYLKLADDTYFFGESVDRSFRQQIEAADKIWSYLSTAQKKFMIAMYERYADVMESWSIPKLQAAATA